MCSSQYSKLPSHFEQNLKLSSGLDSEVLPQIAHLCFAIDEDLYFICGRELCDEPVLPEFSPVLPP